MSKDQEKFFRNLVNLFHQYDMSLTVNEMSPEFTDSYGVYWGELWWLERRDDKTVIGVQYYGELYEFENS